MKKTKNIYKKAILADSKLIEEFNKSDLSFFKDCGIILNNYSVEIINTKTHNIIRIPLIIKCAFDGTDYSFYEFVTGEEYHRINSRSTLLKGEEGNIKLMLSDSPVYNNTLVALLEEINEDEKAAYIYGMEQLPVVSKNMQVYKEIPTQKDNQDTSEEYLDSFVKKFKQN
mgnify:FL=1